MADQTVTVFTTRPDTLFGATFFVVAADAPLALELCAPSQVAALEAYRDERMAGGHRWPSADEALRYAVHEAQRIIRNKPGLLHC